MPGIKPTSLRSCVRRHVSSAHWSTSPANNRYQCVGCGRLAAGRAFARNNDVPSVTCPKAEVFCENDDLENVGITPSGAPCSWSRGLGRPSVQGCAPPSGVPHAERHAGMPVDCTPSDRTRGLGSGPLGDELMRREHVQAAKGVDGVMIVERGGELLQDRDRILGAFKRTSSRLKVFTDASQTPTLSGLRTGVRHATRFRAVAKSTVSAAV